MSDNAGPVTGHPAGAFFGAGPSAAPAAPVTPAASAAPTAPAASAAPFTPPPSGALFGVPAAAPAPAAPAAAPSALPTLPGVNFAPMPAPAAPPAPTPASPPAPTGQQPPAVPPAPAPTTSPAPIDLNALLAPQNPAAPPPPAPALAPQNPAAPPQPGTNWWDSHPDPAVRELMGQKAYADVNALATAYFNANKLISGARDVIAVPPPNADQATWDKFYTAIGRPSAPEGYDFRALATIPGAQPEADMVNFGRKFFHAVGVPQERVGDALRMWETFASEQRAKIARIVADNTAKVEADKQAVNNTALTTVRSTWQGDFEADMAKGAAIVKAIGLGNDDLRAVEGATGSAPVARLFGLLGKLLGREPEVTALLANAGNPNFGTTPDAEIARLQGDATFMAAYNDARHPQHAEALARMDNLYKAKRTAA